MEVLTNNNSSKEKLRKVAVRETPFKGGWSKFLLKEVSLNRLKTLSKESEKEFSSLTTPATEAGYVEVRGLWVPLNKLLECI